MKLRNPIQSALETWLTRLAFLIIPLLSRKAVLRLSRAMGSLAFRFSRKLKRIGMTNLDIAFGDQINLSRKEEILRRSFQSFSLVLLDTFWFFKNTQQRISNYVAFDPCFEKLFVDKAHVTITAHYGNWEILGMAITWKGFPLHSVAMPLKNKAVDALFIEARRVTGQYIVKREGAVRTLYRILQKKGKIGLVMDQNTKLSEGGQFVPFFNLPALVGTAAAGLAIKTQSDLIIVMMRCGSDGIYRGHYCTETPVAPYLNQDVKTATTNLTRKITLEIEQFIRENPENWLWTYKRWKYIPEGDDENKYPFYRRKAE